MPASERSVGPSDVQGLLVWTKSKSVHLYNEHLRNGYKWTGVKMLKLERVGGWAGANALNSCVGQ